MADYFHAHYGKSAGIIVGIMCTLSMGGWIITNLIAGGLLLSEISSWSNIFTTSALAITIASYLLVGGFNSVVRTDIIQYISLLFIATLIGIFFLNTPEIISDSATFSIEKMPIGKIIVFLLVGTIFPMGSAELWQRVYATEKESDFKTAIIVASVSFLIIGGLLSYVCFKLLGANILTPDIAPELSLAVGVSKILENTNPMLSALWFIAFAAAILSSADTFIYTTASSAVQDIWQRLGIVDKNNTVYWIRIAIFILAILGILGAMLFKNVVAVTFYFLGVSLILGVVSLATWIRKSSLSTVSLIGASLVGFIASTVYAFIKGIDMNTTIIAFVSTLIFLIVSELMVSIYRYFQSR